MGKVIVIEAVDRDRKDEQIGLLKQKLSDKYGEQNVYIHTLPKCEAKETQDQATPEIASIIYACEGFVEFNNYNDDLFEQTGCINLAEFYNQENTILVLDKCTSHSIVNQLIEKSDSNAELDLVDLVQQAESNLFELLKPNITLYLDNMHSKTTDESSLELQKIFKETGLLITKTLGWGIVGCTFKDVSLKTSEGVSNSVEQHLVSSMIL